MLKNWFSGAKSWHQECVSEWLRQKRSCRRDSGHGGSVRFGGRLLKGRFPGTRHRGWTASVSVRPTKAALARLPCDEAIHERIAVHQGRIPTRAPSIPDLPPFDAAPDFQAIHDILLDQPLPRLQPTKDDVFLQSCGGLLAFALCHIFGNLAHSNPLNPLRT